MSVKATRTPAQRRRRRLAYRLQKITKAEAPYRDRGIVYLAGVDEAGVGPLAGPVVAAAVIMDPARKPVRGVHDSKMLTEPERRRVADEIKGQAVSWAVGMARPREIDRVNIYQAALTSMRRAVMRLTPVPELVLVDARNIPQLPLAQEGHIKGDGKFYHIACASILAKTFRDALMERMERRYPGYGFSEHKGYPTEEHRDAIRRLGPSRIHRKSFRWLPEGNVDQQTLDDLWDLPAPAE